MADEPDAAWRRPLALALALLAAPAAAGVARADRIVLRGGGQIRGKVIADPAHPERVAILGEKGKTPLSFRKDQVLRVEPEAGPLDEYVTRRAECPETAEEQHKLGLWCRRYKLDDLAAVHFERAVRLDPSFAPAHEKLGHVLYGDRWLSGDELREAQGLVRDKGKWVTREEKERREEQAAAAAEQASWTRRIRQLRQAIASGPSDRRLEAERLLMEIREPAAVGPLMRVLADDDAETRTLLDHVLGAIPGPEAASALARRILVENDSDVRGTTFEELGRRAEPNIVPTLVRALRSPEPKVVNRAAWALGNLDAVAVVPKLIPALVTPETKVVMVMPSGGGGSGGGGLSASFGSVSPRPVAGGYVPVPTVGAGSIAFGLAGINSPALARMGLPSGGSGPRGPVPKLVTVASQNVEVLGALVRLTGRDFGFDVAAWRHWVSTSFRPDPAPSRRVPQP